jgi:hypothetical protein
MVYLLIIEVLLEEVVVEYIMLIYDTITIKLKK